MLLCFLALMGGEKRVRRKQCKMTLERGVYQTQGLVHVLGIWEFILSAMRRWWGILAGSREDHQCVLERLPRLQCGDHIEGKRPVRKPSSAQLVLILCTLPYIISLFRNILLSPQIRTNSTLPLSTLKWRAIQTLLDFPLPQSLISQFMGPRYTQLWCIIHSCTEPQQFCGAEHKAFHLCFPIIITCIVSWKILSDMIIY